MDKTVLQKPAQVTDVILMVRPAEFGYNPETAANNAFQEEPGRLADEEIARRARREFDAFVALLRAAGIRILVAEERERSARPDAVFPNNWVSFHADGTIITYPLFSPIRRGERREAILDMVRGAFDFPRRIRLEGHEAEGRFLEGTGSMILDRPNRIAYACQSPRTHLDLFEAWCADHGYRAFGFHGVDAEGTPIYHTNVMMALGEHFAVLCLDTLREPRERQMLLDQLAATGKEVIPISLEQMAAFAGNMLQVRNREGKPFVVMSEQAFQALDPTQIARLERHGQLLHSPIPTLEAYGGGSVRCMMAEVFVPKKTAPPASVEAEGTGRRSSETGRKA